ncbi:MAG: energy transducer TonB [Raineya sp.]|jgi:protein TonB|nr:energy transducer TonB [Raineya sp.]
MAKSIFLLFFSFFLISSAYAQGVLTSAEQPPEPVGGLKPFYDYISANLKYPEEAKAKKIEGRVHVTFIVETDGSITNVKVSKGLGGGCDEEAIRLIKNAPKWNPGKQGGSPVRVEVTRPITFKL